LTDLGRAPIRRRQLASHRRECSRANSVGGSCQLSVKVLSSSGVSKIVCGAIRSPRST
jgi:hypothetical protein